MKLLDRDARRAQLLALRANDPLQVVALYRQAIGLNQCSMLPAAMNLTYLVESILDHELAVGRLLEPIL